MKVEGKEIQDGKEDVILKINGKEFLRLGAEGYQEIGMNYEEAKDFLLMITQKLAGIAEAFMALSKERK